MKVFDRVNFIGGFIATLGVSILGKYWFLFAAFLALNIIDYVTGFVKAKWFEKNESSAIGAKGAMKKVGYWVVIGIAFFMSDCFVKMGEVICINLSFMLIFGWFTLATYIINEIRSIFENLAIMGVKVPSFLLNGLDITNRLLEKKVNSEEERKNA